MADILLDTLKNGLDNNSLSLLETDENLVEECENYLQDLLINDEFLSTDTYTTNAPEDFNRDSKSRNLIEEIAELDQSMRQINLNLGSVTNDNQEMIIEISSDLKQINHNFNDVFAADVDYIVKLLENLRSIDGSKFEVSVNDKLKAGLEIHNNILSNMEQILDILELPALCKLFILQGNYQEALEISVMVQALVIRFPGLSFFKVINNQIESELKIMVKGLIKLLSTNLKQNHILKIFRILNQLDILDYGSDFFLEYLSEKALLKGKFLKIVYLNSRFKFVVNEISNISPLINYNKLTYLKRLVEVYREHIFTSLSVYHAIFTSPISFSNNEKGSDTLLISQFIKSLAMLLIDKLEQYFPEIKSSDNNGSEGIDEIQSQKEGIILQLLYLCKSLSKYNVDFENIITWNLCYKGETPVINEQDWLRNLAKIKKFK